MPKRRRTARGVGAADLKGPIRCARVGHRAATKRGSRYRNQRSKRRPTSALPSAHPQPVSTDQHRIARPVRTQSRQTRVRSRQRLLASKRRPHARSPRRSLRKSPCQSPRRPSRPSYARRQCARDPRHVPAPSRGRKRAQTMPYLYAAARLHVGVIECMYGCGV